MKTPGSFGKAREMHDTELQSYSDDARSLAHALGLMVEAYLRTSQSPLEALNDAQCKAAYEAGKALGAHSKFIRTKNPQEL